MNDPDVLTWVVVLLLLAAICGGLGAFCYGVVTLITDVIDYFLGDE